MDFASERDSCVLKLKGLPYSTTHQDVLSFFAGFKIRRVEFVLEADGRPSGLAFAEFEGAGDALTAMRKNGEYIGDRYVKLLHVPKQEMEDQVKFGTAAIPKPGRSLAACVPALMHPQVDQQFFGIPYPVGAVGTTPMSNGFAMGWQGSSPTQLGLSAAQAQLSLIAMRNTISMGRLPTAPKILDDGSTVRIRGLPFRVTEAEVVAFFEGHNVVGESVFLGADASGRPTGEGWITFSDPDAARRAIREKNRQYLHHRYLELSPMHPPKPNDTESSI